MSGNITETQGAAPAGTAGSMPATPRRRFRFSHGLLIFAAFLAVIIITGGVLFWNYLGAYEVSLPDHIITDMLENIDYDFWESELNKTLLRSLTEFEQSNSEEIFQLYRGLVRDVPYAIRQNSGENTDDLLVYTIRAGMRDIGRLHLAKAHSIGWGFHMWETGSVSFLDSFISDLPRYISITASQNALVEINGIPVGDELRIESDAQFAKTYRVGNIFGEPEVKVTEWDGEVTLPYYADGSIYLYPILQPFSRTFHIEASDIIDIFINGEVIAPESITDAKILPEVIGGYFTEFAQPPAAPSYMIRYEHTMDMLYEEPVVTAAVRAGSPEGIAIYQKERSDGTVIYEAGMPAADIESRMAAAEDFIRAYVRFTANVDDAISGNFAELSNFMLRDSDLHQRMRSILFEMRWAEVTTVTYNSLDFEHFKAYGDDYFSCRIHYNLTQRLRAGVREVPGDYEVLFMFTGSKWVAVWMSRI